MLPCAVVATTGTTATTAIDPVAAGRWSAMNVSNIPSGFSALTSAPVSAETRKVTSPSGIGRRSSGTPFRASRMN